MRSFLDNDSNLFLLAILLMLSLGKLMGNFSKTLQFPEISGELLAGILLGPTILGVINPNFYQILFLGNTQTTLDIFFNFSLILIMFVTGLSLNISYAIVQMKKTYLITFFGFLFPFITGASVGYLFPNLFCNETSNFLFPLFLGTAFSISALPVIAKILMEIKIIHTPLGAIIISSALLTDIVGFGLFILLTKNQEVSESLAALLILSGFICMLILGRKHISKYFSSIFKRQWIEFGVSSSLSVCLLCSMCFKFLSLEPCVGSLLAGVLLGNVFKMSGETKETLQKFIMNFFAPIFFVSIGLKTDFIKNFNWILVALIFLSASISKITGAFIGAYLAGIRIRERLIVSFALNARGAMEIVFATVALNIGIVSHSTYVALIFMAFLTSIISGLVIRRVMEPNNNYSILPIISPTAH